MTLATWRIQFPEFRGVPDAMAQAFLDAALLEIDTMIWGDTADQGQAYLAAHRMATSPFGQNAKLITSPQANGYRRTNYGQSYLELQIQASYGFRVC